MSMKSLFATAAAVGMMLTGASIAEAKGNCVKAGGEATMATDALARFMANAALENSIKGKGLKASGPVKMTCKTELLTHCIATQKACK